jgi:REST corepressor 1
MLALFSGVRKFGKNFKTIAEVLGTKTEAHVRSFYVNYKRRYGLGTYTTLKVDLFLEFCFS